MIKHLAGIVAFNSTLTVTCRLGEEDFFDFAVVAAGMYCMIYE